MNDILAKAAEYESRYYVVGRAHYLAADHCSRLNRWLGIPVVIITAVVGTTIFATLEKNPAAEWKIAAGLISLCGAVLSSLQTSLGFSQTAEKHKIAGANYRAIRRELELFRLKYSGDGNQRAAAIAELEGIAKNLSDLAAESPTVPDRYHFKAKRELTSKEVSSTISGGSG